MALLLFAAFLNQPSDPVKSNKDLIKFSHSLHHELVECADFKFTPANLKKQFYKI